MDPGSSESLYIRMRIKIFVIWFILTQPGVGWISSLPFSPINGGQVLSMKYNRTTKAWDEPHLIDKLGRSGWVEVEVESTAKRERWLANPY